MTYEERLEYALNLCRNTHQESKAGKKGQGPGFKAMVELKTAAWANLEEEEKKKYEDAIKEAKRIVCEENE